MNFRKLLLPLSYLYGAAASLRNFLYNTGILMSEKFAVPVICIGNLNAGGTGKTPHVEYIIRLLKDKFTIATLSRGYGRSSTGFLFAKPEMNAEMLGDEPLQYFLKYPEVIVSVSESRAGGIKRILSKHPGIEAILMDDALQHRSVKAGLNILITDYSDLFTDDTILPSGNLREPKSGYKRAGIIVVSKCPENLSQAEKEKIISKIKPLPGQQVLFSFLKYESPVSFHNGKEQINPAQLKEYEVLLITGIANPSPLSEYLKSKTGAFYPMTFRDHHMFTKSDLLSAQKIFNNIASSKKILVTTEKDFMRLRKEELKKIILQLPFYYLPVKVEFNETDKKLFDELILNYVGKN